MSDHFIGEICNFPFDFEPEGWLPCDGRELPVQAHQALYSIIANKFGGDSRTFRLPNLTGMAVMGFSREIPFGQVVGAHAPAATGDGQEKCQPHLAMAYYICNDGDYPARSDN